MPRAGFALAGSPRRYEVEHLLLAADHWLKTLWSKSPVKSLTLLVFELLGETVQVRVRRDGPGTDADGTVSYLHVIPAVVTHWRVLHQTMLYC